MGSASNARRARVERGIYLQSNGKYETPARPRTSSASPGIVLPGRSGRASGAPRRLGRLGLGASVPALRRLFG